MYGEVTQHDRCLVNSLHRTQSAVVTGIVIYSVMHAGLRTLHKGCIRPLACFWQHDSLAGKRCGVAVGVYTKASGGMIDFWIARLVVLASSVLIAVMVGVVCRSRIAVFGPQCYTFWHPQANVCVFAQGSDGAQSLWYLVESVASH
jgi:hypothetical protein